MVISRGTNNSSFCRAAAPNLGSAKNGRVERYTELDSATLLWISSAVRFFFQICCFYEERCMRPSKCFTGDSDELTECCAQHVSLL